MTLETSRNPDYAPLVKGAIPQAPVPQTVHNLPGSVAASGSVTTSLIRADGFTMIAAGLTMTQSGSLSVQRYLDDGGTQVQGAPVTVPVTANVPANLDVLDGKPFAAFILTVANGAGSASTITGFALLLQASPSNQQDSAADGSSVLTSAGVAQTLFGGVVPVNGFALYNPDSTNDLWVCEGGSAVANGSGSVRVAANGGWYETPVQYRPMGAVSLVGMIAGQKFTARRW